MTVDLYDSLAGQTALVTGATRGIGKRIAVDLRDLGATVFAGARDTDDVGAAGLEPVRLDVTDRASVADAIETVAGRTDRLDVLVNNAGVYGPAGRLDGLDPDGVEVTLRTNLHGPITVTRHAIGLLGAGSRVVNMTSRAGQFETGLDPNHLPYAASKAGLNAFTVCLDDQYDDLLVNAASPGWVRTDMGGPEAPRSVEEGADTPVWLARFRDGPSGRVWRDRETQAW